MGFANVIQFMFIFFTVIFIFGVAFFVYNDQIDRQQFLIHRFEESQLKGPTFLYNISNPYYNSGRINLRIENQGSDLSYVNDEGFRCFNYFMNNRFGKEADTFLSPLKPVWGNYTFVEEGDLGIISLREDLVKNGDFVIKVVNCDGESKTIHVNDSLWEWDFSDAKSRSAFSFENNGAAEKSHIAQVHLDSSNFNFSAFNKSQVVFKMPLFEQLVLDLSFDEYEQSIDDHSSLGNIAYLGSNSAVTFSDPQKSDGVVFGGVKFDGNDFVRIEPHKSLELVYALTYSTFFNWGGKGNSSQNIFTNGNDSNSLRIVSDGGIEDGKVAFSLNVDGVNRTIYSSSKISSGWHHVAGTFNGSSMMLFIDGDLSASSDFEGNVTAYPEDNFIGSSGSGNYFNGSIDDVKIFSFALSKSLIEDIITNEMRDVDLEHDVEYWNETSEEAIINVTIPSWQEDANVTFYMYYDYD